MATTYRTPVYGLTKYLKKMLLYESKTNPGTRFEFNVSSSYTDKKCFAYAFHRWNCGTRQFAKLYPANIPFNWAKW